MSGITLTDRVRALELRLESNSVLLQEIHRDVVGDASHKPLLERVSASEAKIGYLEKQVPSWKHRALQAATSTVIAAVAAYFGVHLPGAGGAQG